MSIVVLICAALTKKQQGAGPRLCARSHCVRRLLLPDGPLGFVLEILRKPFKVRIPGRTSECR